jgi:predicted phosphodiesterase
VRVGVFSDVHAHADALQAVMAAAVDAGVDELWSLGDLVGGGPDPECVVALVRAYCRVALAGNHDYAATGSVDATRFGEAGRRSVAFAAERLAASGDLDWLRSRRPAARRAGVQCWHASPRHPVREYVGPANAAACLQRQRAAIGLVGHTHVPAAWRADPDGSATRFEPAADRPLELAGAKWLLNVGAVGAPMAPRGDWWGALAEHGRAGAWWLELDLGGRVATWRRAPFDSGPARERAVAAGLAAPAAAEV